MQGKTLTNSVKQIFTDFQTAAEKFQKLNYDAMNVDATQFADDFAIFCGVIRELERRLGAVIAQVCQINPFRMQVHVCMARASSGIATCADLKFISSVDWGLCDFIGCLGWLNH